VLEDKKKSATRKTKIGKQANSNPFLGTKLDEDFNLVLVLENCKT